MDTCMYAWTDGCTNGLMDDWMGDWGVDGRMDGERQGGSLGCGGNVGGRESRSRNVILPESFGLGGFGSQKPSKKKIGWVLAEVNRLIQKK